MKSYNQFVQEKSETDQLIEALNNPAIMLILLKMIKNLLHYLDIMVVIFIHMKLKKIVKVNG